jgi:hypothetical protein
LRPFIEGSSFLFDLFDFLFVFLLRAFERPFGRCNCLLAPLPPLLPTGFFLPTRGLTSLLLPLECDRGVLGGFIVGFASCRFFFLRLRLLSVFLGAVYVGWAR